MKSLHAKLGWGLSHRRPKRRICTSRAESHGLRAFCMDDRSLNYITDACAGERLSGTEELLVSRVCTDSRATRNGDLFVAIRGARFDGHEFLQEAVHRGARAVLAERARVPENLNCAVIAVPDTVQALGMLADRYRRDFDLPVIGVAGSNGKTTTKELLAAVLRQRFHTLWSEASFNNHLGVPLTLLRLERAHQAAVLELGTNHPGELAPLVQMAAPTLGILTSIGREHLEFFGSLEGVVAEEGWLAELLPPTGTLYLQGDSPWADVIAARCKARTVRAGFQPGNHWRATITRLDRQGTSFRVSGPLPEFEGEFRVPLIGRHQALNALLALAAAADLGVSADEARRGLLACEPPKMRMQLYEWNGARILDDAYNANADSMLAALQTLQELPCKGRRLAVLGDMAELGPHEEAAHVEIGRHVAALGIGQLFAVGQMASVMGRAAREGGLTRVLEFREAESAAAAVKAFLKPGDLLLLKASRAARLERISEALKKNE